MIIRRRDGRGRGGGDDTTMDNNDEDNDNDNNNNNDDNNYDRNNTTIKQCTGVRGRRKSVAVMDDGGQQKWHLSQRNSARGIKEEKCMTIDKRQLHDG
jgi:hypothetical protein